jgi:hypothetical protein
VREARQLRRRGRAMRVRRQRHSAPVWNSRALIRVRVEAWVWWILEGVFSPSDAASHQLVLQAQLHARVQAGRA